MQQQSEIEMRHLPAISIYVYVGVDWFKLYIYIYFMRSETLPSACCILTDESSTPFYSTSNGNNGNSFRDHSVNRSTRLIILIKNIHTLYCWKRYLLLVTYLLSDVYNVPLFSTGRTYKNWPDKPRNQNPTNINSALIENYKYLKNFIHFNGYSVVMALMPFESFFSKFTLFTFTRISRETKIRQT